MIPRSIAFFDVDYTLVDGNTGFFTSLRLLKHGILKKRRLFQALYYQVAQAVMGAQDVRKIYEIAIADMAGHTLKRVLEIGRECFELDVKKRLFSHIVEQLQEHQKKGDVVVLLTSAPYMLVQILKEYLKADEAYCMGPEIEEGILVQRLQEPLCYAEGKAYYAQLAAQKYGTELKYCHFYTDHISDLFLLEKVGHPHPVNPEFRLKQEAQKRGWQIILPRR